MKLARLLPEKLFLGNPKGTYIDRVRITNTNLASEKII